MAWNIPFLFVTYQRKNGKTEHGIKMSQDFVAEVQKIASPTDILLVTWQGAMVISTMAIPGSQSNGLWVCGQIVV
jgi:hypothetical protein